MAGAVYAAAVILDPAQPIHGLADSKQLSSKRRTILAAAIRDRALSWAVASASVQEIDTLNILRASLLAMQRAVLQLAMAPDELAVDGLHLPELNIKGRAIVDGDRLVQEISAASILAKVSRDLDMCRLDAEFPDYGFASHKGYGTARHLAALQAFGPCAIHRRSFAPVRAAEQQLGFAFESNAARLRG